MARNTILRSMHDVGLAGWFGGTLANAVALNSGAAEAGDPQSSGRVVNAGWDRWTPVNAAAIGAHLIGGAGILAANSGRLGGQKGVAAMTVTKTALTAAALGVTAYSRVLGQRLSDEHDVPVEAGTEPHEETPPEQASAQRQLRQMQWAIPALTGAMLVLNALAGEQQRPSEVRKGLVDRLTG